MSGVVALLRLAALRATRGPLLLACVVGVSALLISLPPLGGATPEGAARQRMAFVLRVAAIAVGGAAVAAAAHRTRGALYSHGVRVLGPARAVFGDLCGLLLFTASLGGAVGIAGSAWIGVVGGGLIAPTEAPIVREVLFAESRTLVATAADPIRIVARPSADAKGSAALDMAPRRRRLATKAEGAPESRVVAPSSAVELRWRGAGLKWRVETASLARGRRARVELPWRDAGGPTASLEVIVSPPEGVAIEFRPYDVVLLGESASAQASLLRAALLVAIGAFGAAAMTRAFAAFCSPWIAVSGALCLALAAAAAPDVFGAPAWVGAVASWIPGGGSFDAAEATLHGVATSWGDVGRGLVRAAFPFALAVGAHAARRGNAP